jgi:two-component system response regulator FixJ
MPNGLIYIVDDNEDVRESSIAMLAAYGFRPIAFESGEGFLVECAKQQPLCAIVDVRMPGINGLELLGLIKQRGWSFRVVVITGHGEVETAVKAMKLGAADFLQKPFRPEQLIASITGDKTDAASESLTSEEHRVADPSDERLSVLSNRERQILTLVRRGLSSKEIAEQLNISPATVNNHRAQIRSKMNARSLAHLLSLTNPDVSR